MRKKKVEKFLLELSAHCYSTYTTKCCRTCKYNVLCTSLATPMILDNEERFKKVRDLIMEMDK